MHACQNLRAKPALEQLITAARPAYAGTEGCSILHVLFISLFFI